MAYQKQTREAVGGAGLGPRLGRLALRKGISVIEISRITGASRPTIYRWFYGHGVSRAYTTAVTQLIKRLKNS